MIRQRTIRLAQRAGVLLLLLCGLSGTSVASETVARQWNEALLDAIRIDFPAPTVHSRNLYHLSAAMYDVWAAYDEASTGVFVREKFTDPIDITAARNEAISYAAYRILSDRYQLAVDPEASQARFDAVMDSLGYDRSITTTVGDSPAAFGNRVANSILSRTIDDGSNEANAYVDNTGYVPVNEAMVVDHPSVTGPENMALADPNQWQPLYVTSAFTQNGLEGSNLQEYIGPHWGSVTTFAMGRDGGGPTSWHAIDPGAPPQLGGAETDLFRDYAVSVIRYSNRLDPNQGAGAEYINISPSVAGNRPLGTHTDVGYAVNPVTGMPYADNRVKRADYGRVLAEFWADGPDSETPPGHWNVLANQVTDSPLLEKRIGGTGPIVDDLEWDVKMYLSLNGATHDAAVGAWGVKREYNYVRPITMIRYMGSLGQSSDPSDTDTYHPLGLPLEEGVIELITAESIADGGKHRNVYLNANRLSNGIFLPDFYYSEEELVGELALNVWNHEPPDPETQVSGIDWVLSQNWVPFQKDNFVTPAFAAYVSGHSTFSRAAAEVLAALTGSPYFPGGLGELEFEMNEFLDFEQGPSETITLQWASYYDAADEAGISRLHGGIHVAPDDFAGRIMGASIGSEAFALAEKYFNGSLVVVGDLNEDGAIDAADAGILFSNWGATGAGDLNRDRLIDAADAGILFANWTGDLQSTAATNAVPETVPSGALIVLLSCIAISFRAR